MAFDEVKDCIENAWGDTQHVDKAVMMGWILGMFSCKMKLTSFGNGNMRMKIASGHDSVDGSTVSLKLLE